MMTVWWFILKNDDSMVSYMLKNDDSMVSYTKEWWQYGELY